MNPYFMNSGLSSLKKKRNSVLNFDCLSSKSLWPKFVFGIFFANLILPAERRRFLRTKRTNIRPAIDSKKANIGTDTDSTKYLL